MDEVLIGQRAAVDACRAVLERLHVVCAELLAGDAVTVTVAHLREGWALVKIAELLRILNFPAVRLLLVDSPVADEGEVGLEDAEDVVARQAEAAAGGDSAAKADAAGAAEREAKKAEGRDGGGDGGGADLGAGVGEAKAVEGKDGAAPSKGAGDGAALAMGVGEAKGRGGGHGRAASEASAAASFAGSFVALDAVPVDLMRATEWLLHVKDVPLFRHVWDGSADAPMPQRLFEAAAEWTRIYEEIDTSTFTAGRAREMLKAMGADVPAAEQLAALSETRAPLAGGAAAAWAVGEGRGARWVKQRLHELHLFEKLVALQDRLDTVLSDEFKVFMDAFLNEGARAQRDAAWVLFLEMRLRYSEEMTLSELKHLDFSSGLGASAEQLLQLPPAFLATLGGATELLLWIQSSVNLHSDEDFAQTLEVCRSKGELERPDELVDSGALEDRLGALASVRSSFHKLLFRETEGFDDLTEFLRVLVVCASGRNADSLRNSVRTCNEVQAAFIELFDDDSDRVAPNRLKAFHDPKRKSRWEITNDGTTVDPSLASMLSLRYELHRGGTTAELHQNLTDLMDFQSILVLASTRSGDSVVRELVDEFTSQLEWLRRINESMYRLHVAGHPQYRAYRCSYSFDTPHEDLRSQARELSGIVVAWAQRVSALHDDHYFVNLLSMNMIWEMIEKLKLTQGAGAEAEAACFYLKDWFMVHGYTIDVDAARRRWAAISQAGGSVASWLSFLNANRDADGGAAPESDELELFARWLDAVLDGQARQTRGISAELLSQVNEHGAQDLKPGLNVICHDDAGLAMDHLMSLYCRAGRLPEREELILCTAQGTRLEDARNLVNRWKAAAKFDRADGLYVISAAENLTFEQQRELAEQIELVLFQATGEAEAQEAQADRKHGAAPLAWQSSAEDGDEEDAPEAFAIDEGPAGAGEAKAGAPAGSGEAKGAKGANGVANGAGRSNGAAAGAAGDGAAREGKQAKASPSKGEKVLLNLAPLVLLIGGTRSQYLVEQFQRFRRANVQPLPTEIVQMVTGDVLGIRKCSTLVYQSEGAGNGKTFRLQSDAKASGAVLVHVPIHKYMRPNAFIRHLEHLIEDCTASLVDGWDSMAYSSAVAPRVDRGALRFHGMRSALDTVLGGRQLTFHFDLSATTPRSFDTTLFETVVFHGVLDTATGRLFSLAASHASGPSGGNPFDDPPLGARTTPCSIAVEVASGRASGMARGTRLAELLPQRPVLMSAELFAATEAALRAGHMGYDSCRGDGTTEATAQSTLTQRNAFVRLQLVCKALQHLAEGGGFAPSFEADAIEDLDGATCFLLLQQHMRLEAGAQPNLHQVWSFVNVLYWQLMDLHHDSSIANSVAFSETMDSGDARSTFKGHLVEFVVRTALDIAAPGTRQDATGELRVKKWQDSNHEFVMFQITGRRGVGDDGGGISFLSLNPEVMRRNMNQEFRATTENYGLVIGEDLDSLVKRHSQVLNIVTGNTLSEAECAALLGGHYCITGDSVLKMIAIFVRIKCGIPVILCGECGCGKTELIRYTCEYLGATLFILDCHGGTEEEEIHRVFEQAEAKARLVHGESQRRAGDAGSSVIVVGSRVTARRRRCRGPERRRRQLRRRVAGPLHRALRRDGRGARVPRHDPDEGGAAGAADAAAPG